MSSKDPRSNLTDTERDAILRCALAITARSRDFILDSVAAGFQVAEKDDQSLVTNVDKGVETIVREVVAKEFPTHGVLGEEYGHTNPGATVQWVVDPIDGTTDFTRAIPLYGTVLGVFIDQQPIVGVLDFPGLDSRYWAAHRAGAFCNDRRLPLRKGSARKIITLPPRICFSRFGLSTEPHTRVADAFPDHRVFWTCYTHALAASGSTDASAEFNLRIWDVAAVQILVEEAGKKCLWLELPKPWASGKCSLVIGDPALVDEIVATLADFYPPSSSR